MAKEGQVIRVNTLKEWNQQLQKGNDSKKLVVVDFTTPASASILAEFARTIPNVIFLKVAMDVNELKSVAKDYAAESKPTIIFLKEGKIVDKVVDAKKEELQKKIAKHAAATPTDTPTPGCVTATATATASESATATATASATASPTSHTTA